MTSPVANNLPTSTQRAAPTGQQTELARQSTAQQSAAWQSSVDRPYGCLADWTVQRLRPSPLSDPSHENNTNVAALITPDSSQMYRVGSLNAKFTLWAHQWRIEAHDEHLATCRMVMIQGAQNEIINTWIFPTSPATRPVFAAELIALSGAPRLTFIDIQTPGMLAGCDLVQAATQRLRADFQTIASDDTPPEWAIADSPGGYVFSRNLNADAFETIQACYRAFVECYLREFVDRVAHVSGGEHPDRELSSLSQLDAYQQHHLSSSPGSVFLGKLFGAAWTDRFLQQFLFTRA
jgi:hypothetical protein